LADDDPGVREMLGRVLESEHYEVILATDGNDAAAKSLARKPALALLDLNMPGRDGWSAFRFLDAAHALLPVIIITARSDQYAQAQGMHVDAIMEKPLDLPVLLDAIEQLLAESDSDRKLRLTDDNFRTARLNHGPAVPDAKASR
jgi:DNA-binding response OmpR family regulator